MPVGSEGRSSSNELKEKFIAEKGVKKLPAADLRGDSHGRLRREIMSFNMDSLPSPELSL